MKTLWRHVEYNYREGGILQVLYKCVWRLQEWLWSESAWLIYRLDVSTYQRGTRLPLERSSLGFSTLVQLQYFKALAFPEAIAGRLTSGAVCHGFFLGGELVNIAWTMHGYLELESGLIRPEQKSVGIFDCFTLPAHRAKGIYTDSLIALVQLIRSQGAGVALIAVDPVNHASIKGIERAGFQAFSLLRRVRRFGRESIEESAFELHDPSTAPSLHASRKRADRTPSK